jgi:hypothetical protein
MTEPRTYKVILLDNTRQRFPLVKPEHLPIKLELDVCKGCGQMQSSQRAIRTRMRQPIQSTNQSRENMTIKQDNAARNRANV